MIMTTTPTIEGRQIAHYIRIVSSEAISGVNMFKDIGTDNGMFMVTASGTAVKLA